VWRLDGGRAILVAYRIYRGPNHYYGSGWDVQPFVRQPGNCTKWHGGGLAGTSTRQVCRDDGIDSAVFFNSDADKNGKDFADLIDEPLHKVADGIKDSLEGDWFSKFSVRLLHF
jgi:hypothetical protein